MEFVLEQILMCALLGAITAALWDIIILEERNEPLMLVMILLGATVGWFTGLLFVFMTGGLNLSIFWMILPLITVSLVSILFLYRSAVHGSMFTRARWRVGSGLAGILSVVVILLLAAVLVFSVVPISSVTSSTIESFSISGTAGVSEFELPSKDIRVLNTNIAPSFLSVDVERSSVRFPRISENPDEGDYLNFQATFTVQSSGGTWKQPYIKIFVFKDPNGNGQYDSGETTWGTSKMKFPTNAGYWRGNIAWENSHAVKMINSLKFSGVQTILPIFHISEPSIWKDDTGQIVSNTPEGFNVPTDTIPGKIYCPDGYAGTHALVVQAFDFRYTDPWDAGETPLTQKIMTFTVNGGNNDPYCGDGICNGGETHATCPGDCPGNDDPYCGDGICNGGETHATCPGDCPSGTHTLTVNTNPTFCTVAVDGMGSKDSGSSGLAVFTGIPAGFQKIVTVSKSGYTSATRYVTMDSNQEIDVTLQPVKTNEFSSWLVGGALLGITILGTAVIWRSGPKFLKKK
jgi:hypothetical protein